MLRQCVPGNGVCALPKAGQDQHVIHPYVVQVVLMDNVLVLITVNVTIIGLEMIAIHPLYQQLLVLVLLFLAVLVQAVVTVVPLVLLLQQ